MSIGQLDPNDILQLVRMVTATATGRLDGSKYSVFSGTLSGRNAGRNREHVTLHVTLLCQGLSFAATLQIRLRGGSGEAT